MLINTDMLERPLNMPDTRTGLAAAPGPGCFAGPGQQRAWQHRCARLLRPDLPGAGCRLQSCAALWARQCPGRPMPPGHRTARSACISPVLATKHGVADLYEQINIDNDGKAGGSRRLMLTWMLWVMLWARIVASSPGRSLDKNTGMFAVHSPEASPRPAPEAHRFWWGQRRASRLSLIMQLCLVSPSKASLCTSPTLAKPIML